MKFKLRPAVVITISIVIGIIMIISSYFELRQSREEIFHLLKEQSKSLIETISLSSINTLNSGVELEDMITERLLNNASLIKSLDSLNLLSRKKLIEISDQNDLYRINIFDRNGNRVLSNRIPEEGHLHGPEKVNRYEEVGPILEGETEELIIGLKDAEYVDEKRFAVAVSRAKNKGGAIVLNLNAADFIEFRKKIGIGKIIQDISDNEGLVYLILQDSIGILAAGQGVNEAAPVEGDKFLGEAFNSDLTFSRVNEFKDEDVYEVVKRLKYDDEIIGIFRLGLSLNEVKLVEERMLRRLIIISLVLAAISVVVLSIVFTNQNLKSVSNEYSKFKSLTWSVFQNMDEAVIVVNKNKEIALFNIAAEKLFQKPGSKVIGKNLNDISSANFAFLNELLAGANSDSVFEERAVEISGKPYSIILSLTKNYDESGVPQNYIIVIKDITSIKQLQEQSRRNEKLTAMGELASGVAHEIRNPINVIGMVAQRLLKEFNPDENREEYLSITSLLKDEVTRINKIITQFLQFAKPLSVSNEEVKTGDFIEGIFRSFIGQANQKKINFRIDNAGDYAVNTDPDLLKQVLLNIVQNSFDAVEENGEVSLNCRKTDRKIIIEVKDNGKGIPEEVQSKIFDLYFSTKKEGNGLGLSISQKIVNQLGGRLSFTSRRDEGTTFTIELPS